MKSSRCNRLSNAFPFSALFAAACLVATLATVPHQTNAAAYTWTGLAGTDQWSDAGNWSPMGAPGSAADDSASIAQNVTVNSKSLIFDLTPTSGSSMTRTVIDLSNGAKLQVGGDLFVQTQVNGSSVITRNVTIGTDSRLDVSGTFSFGIANQNTGRSGTLTINGDLSVVNFQGLRSANNTGGYNISVNNGSFNVSNVFSWNNHASANSDNDKSSISISNNGSVVISTMASDWTNSNAHKIIFADTSGSFVFGKGNGWSTESEVQWLIDNDYISKNASIAEDFFINDMGDRWQVSFTAIPESATSCLIFMSGIMLLIAYRRIFK